MSITSSIKTSAGRITRTAKPDTDADEFVVPDDLAEHYREPAPTSVVDRLNSTLDMGTGQPYYASYEAALAALRLEALAAAQAAKEQAEKDAEQRERERCRLCTGYNALATPLGRLHSKCELLVADRVRQLRMEALGPADAQRLDDYARAIVEMYPVTGNADYAKGEPLGSAHRAPTW